MEPLCIWSDEVDFPVTICDKEGLIVGMNKKSIEYFKDDGGIDLLGRSLIDCHPEPSRSKLLDLLKNPRANTYISETSTEKLFVHETPWYEKGTYMGFVEILVTIP
ncbi:MAG TPA: hypothetical protein PKK59_00945 [Anaerolineaceae bacterium]|nr:hypothetical protein [Anaerolineaceae bacterium]